MKDVELYEQLFAIRPGLLVHDLHPDYASTRYARERAAREGLGLLAVQHHHAHMASCMAENGLRRADVIGVTFDGTGFGTDGAVWGGEFLVGGLPDVPSRGPPALRRDAGRRTGDPRALADGGWPTSWTPRPAIRSLPARIAASELRLVERMLERQFNTPLTSSAGRLFDAVAALAGVRDRVSFEGQAAMELEWLAAATSAAKALIRSSCRRRVTARRRKHRWSSTPGR